jgi:hypothetical protein
VSAECRGARVRLSADPKHSLIDVGYREARKRFADGRLAGFMAWCLSQAGATIFPAP